MRPFRDLVVWQKAHALTLEVYRFTRDYPRNEWFGLTPQTRRSASSVPGNIAELWQAVQSATPEQRGHRLRLPQ